MDPDQLAQLIAAMAPREGHGKRLTPLKDSSPDAWTAWRIVFQNVANLKNWNDQEAKGQMIAAMEGDCARLVGDIEIPAHYSAAQALDLYSDRFIPAAYGRMARMKFKSAAQEANETIVAWHARLRELYLRAHPNYAAWLETTPEIIETFILHLSHPEVRAKTLDAEVATYSDALTVACSKAATIVVRDQCEGGGKGGNGIQAITGGGDVNAVSDTCFVCQASDHFARRCPHRGRLTTSELRRVNEEMRRVRDRGAARRGGRGGRGRPPQPRRGVDLVQQMGQDGGDAGRRPRRGRAGAAGNAIDALVDALVAIGGTKDNKETASGN